MSSPVINLSLKPTSTALSHLFSPMYSIHISSTLLAHSLSLGHIFSQDLPSTIIHPYSLTLHPLPLTSSIPSHLFLFKLGILLILLIIKEGKLVYKYLKNRELEGEIREGSWDGEIMQVVVGRKKLKVEVNQGKVLEIEDIGKEEMKKKIEQQKTEVIKEEIKEEIKGIETEEEKELDEEIIENKERMLNNKYMKIAKMMNMDGLVGDLGMSIESEEQPSCHSSFNDINYCYNFIEDIVNSVTDNDIFINVLILQNEEALKEIIYKEIEVFKNEIDYF